jgi:signal peptidase I
MSLTLIAVLDLLLLYFIVGHSFLRRFYTRAARARAEVRDIEKHYRHLRTRDRDILPPEVCRSLDSAIAALQQARAPGTPFEASQACLEHYRTGEAVSLPSRTHPRLKENLEMLVVALGLAFGIRALFLQPFKIPTGSMQPTLFGIHFVPRTEPLRLNPVVRFFGYLNYTRRYVDITVQHDGYIDLAGARPARPAVPFFPASLVEVGDVTYKLPGGVDDVCKYLLQMHGMGASLKAGEVLARGALELGDHLFVDRTHLAFQEPRRGDVTVFVTDGIRRANGEALAGRYYIKRLAGLPGDTLEIRDGHLYVREPGAAEFRLVDAQDAPGFGRIYSRRGGYHGYTHMNQAAVLTRNGDTFTVPQGQYFMLGDNSGFSLDSRFWKTVPRENLVGRALCVWWPFSRRWGRVDRVEPQDFDTVSRMHDPRLPPLVEQTSDPSAAPSGPGHAEPADARGAGGHGQRAEHRRLLRHAQEPLQDAAVGEGAQVPQGAVALPREPFDAAARGELDPHRLQPPERLALGRDVGRELAAVRHPDADPPDAAIEPFRRDLLEAQQWPVSRVGQSETVRGLGDAPQLGECRPGQVAQQEPPDLHGAQLRMGKGRPGLEHRVALGGVLLVPPGEHAAHDRLVLLLVPGAEHIRRRRAGTIHQGPQLELENVEAEVLVTEVVEVPAQVDVLLARAVDVVFDHRYHGKSGQGGADLGEFLHDGQVTPVEVIV